MIRTTSKEMFRFFNIEADIKKESHSNFIWGDTSDQGKLYFIINLIKHKLHDKNILEFGTYRGSTTNKISDVLTTGRVCTVDCGFQELKNMLEDESQEHNDKVKYSHYTAGEMCKDKNNIKQIIGNTQHLDIINEIKNAGPFDLIYIDASHTYEGVKNDTLVSFDCISDSGIIIWDDYNSHWTGVNNYLNELSKEKRLFYLEDNRYVLYIDEERA